MALIGKYFKNLSGQNFVAPLVFLLIPVVVISGDRSLLFDIPGYVDPWLYYALFRNLRALMHLFPNTYYGSRLSLIIPGYLVNKILPPLAANYTLHILIWLCAVLSLCVVIKNLVDSRTALLSVAVFGFYPFLWRAVGWDAPDGAGIAYYLLTTALLTVASTRQMPPRGLMAAAGAAAAGALYTNLQLAFFLPFFFMYWFAIRRLRAYRPEWVTAITWSLGGGALVTVALGVINHAFGGSYDFYLPSITFALNFSHQANPYRAKSLAWVRNAYWLILPALGMIVGAILCIRLWKTRDTFKSKVYFVAYLHLLFCVAVLSIFEFGLDGAQLEIFYYASYLIPAVAIFFGCSVLRVPVRLNDRSFNVLLACTILCFSWVRFDQSGFVLTHLLAWGWIPMFAMAAGGMLLAAVRPETMGGLIGALVNLCIVMLTVHSPVGPSYVHTPNETENAFLRIERSMSYCEMARQERRIVFWVDGKDPYGQEFASLIGTYFYEFALYGYKFPELGNGAPVDDNTLIVIPSSTMDPRAQARRVLESAGFVVDVLPQKTVEAGNGRYTLSFIATREDPIKVLNRRSVSNGDFESGVAPWTGGGAELRTVEGGQSGRCLELRGEQGSSQYAIEWDQLKLIPGKQYTMRFWVKSSPTGDERFQAGIWDSKAMQWMAFKEGKSTDKWIQYTTDFTNTSANQLSVEVLKNSATKGAILFDTVSVVPKE